MPLALLFMTTFFLSMTLLVLSREQGVARKVFSPYGLFIVFFSSVFYFIPAIQITLGVGRFPSLIDGSSYYMLFSLLLALIYQGVVGFVFFILKRPKVSYKFASKSSVNFDNSSHAVLVALVVAFALGLVFVLKIVSANIYDFSGFMSNRINILSGSAYFFKMVSYSLPILLLIYLRSRGSVFSFLFISIAIVNFIVFTLLGSRTTAILIVPYILFAYVLIKPNERLKFNLMIKGVGLFALLMFSMMLLSDIREGMKSDGIESIGTNFSENNETSTTSDLFKQFYLNFGHAELLAITIERRSSYEMALGHTIYSGLISFVPRVIWENKPVGGGPMLANIISPGAYALGKKEGNSSYTTGAVIEGYLNFGVVGVVLIAFIHAFILVKVTIYSYKLKNSADFVLYIILLVSCGTTFTTGEFSGVFSSLIFTIVPIYFINSIYRGWRSNEI